MPMHNRLLSITLALSIALTLSACQLTNDQNVLEGNNDSLESSSSMSSVSSTSDSGIEASADSASSVSSSKKQGVKIPVDWKKPTKVVPQDFFMKVGQLKAVQAFVENVITSNGGTPTPELVKRQIDEIDLHAVGTVSGGMYAGGELFVYTMNCFDVFDMPCYPYWSPALRIIVLKDKSVIALTRHTSTWNDAEQVDTGFRVSEDDDGELDIAMPTIIKIPNSTYVLHKIATSHEMVDETPKDLLFTSDEINKSVYADKKTGCIIIENNDGTTSIYEISYTFNPKQDPYFLEPASQNEKKRLTFSITWKDGQKSDSAYSHGVFGCDPHKTCYNVVSIVNEKLHTDLGDFALEDVGKLSTGEAVMQEVYTPTDVKAFTGSNMRDLSQVYSNYYVDGTKMTASNFYQSHPVIYIKDPFGRWLRWLKEDYLPAAECGKPVIYLYPPTVQIVSVNVAPNKGLTITDPPYGNGWRVKATPESVLTTSDGKTYPYLFWEGITNGYAAPKEGFVIAKNDIARVLGEKLALLGLNEKERKDFLEFWAPKMQEKPLYFVTFLPQSYFESLAPLTVQPRPDTIIRVFMDYKGLDAPIAVTPLTIKTPKRTGFTVVEWGGALNRE